MNCISCKKKIPDDAVFCQFCGKKQSVVNPSYRRRGNGFGSAYVNSFGSWTAETTLGYYIVDGKKKRKRHRKAGFKTKKEALRYLETLTAGNAPVNNIKMCELWEMCVPDVEKISSSKRAAYFGAWKKLSPSLGWRNIADITAHDLQTTIDGIADTYYPRRDAKAVLLRLYKKALQEDLIDKNRAEFIELPPKPEAEHDIFTAEDKQILWDDFNATHARVTAAILMMLYTGMRPAELLNIDVDNVRLDEHYMTGGKKTEKGKRRKIIIPDCIIPVVENLLETSERGKLCYIYKTDFYDRWNAKRQALGLRETLVPYSCRHTYITELTALNVSPAMLKELAGHEDYETTLNYTHLSVEDRLKEVNRLK